MSKGLAVIAYGATARGEATTCLRTQLAINPAWTSIVISDLRLSSWPHLYAPSLDPAARFVKLSLDLLAPFEEVCYLDANTKVLGPLSVGFTILEDGWDLVATASTRQGADLFGDYPQADREATFEELGYRNILEIQSNVLWFRKSEVTTRLFAAWRAEWEQFRGMDQAALLRALKVVPVKVYLLGRPWNGAGLP